MPQLRNPAVCIVATLLAVLVRWILDPLLADSGQYTPFYLSVAIIASYTGLALGLVSVLVSAGLGFALFVYLPGRFTPGIAQDYLQLCLFIVVAGLIVGMAERARRRERLASGAMRLLEGIADGTEDLIAALDLSFRYVALNRAYQKEFEQVFGRVIQLGDNLKEVLKHLPEEREKLIALWTRASSDESFTVTQEMGDPARERRIYEMHFSPLHDSGGALFGAAHIVRNVTRRVRSEEALRRNEALLAQAEKLSRSSAWEWDMETDRWTFSSQWPAIHGSSKQVLSSAELLPIAHPDDADRVSKALADAREKHLPYELEHRIIHQVSGEVLNIKSHGELIPDSSGKPIRMQGFAQDITEHKQAEEKLLESERRLRNVVENLSEGLIVVDPNGTALQWNRAALSMHGYSNPEAALSFLGTLVDLYKIFTPEGKAVPFDQWPIPRILRGEEFKDYELLVRRPHDGWERIFSYAGTMVYNNQGAPSMGLLTIRDITRRKHAEMAVLESRQALMRARDELERRVDERTAELRRLTAHLDKVREEESRRIANEIHDELGQALAVAKLDLSAMKAGTQDPEQRKRLDRVLGTVGEVADQVRRISHNLHPRVLDVLGLKAALESHCEEFEERTHIRCEIHVPADLPGDRNGYCMPLFRIFQEALSNVARHAEASQVAVDVKTAGGQLFMEIADNGKGLDLSKASPDSLGLAGMRERAIRLGGEACIENIENPSGTGTRVRVRIPLRNAE